jgi:hypothetical protein
MMTTISVAHQLFEIQREAHQLLEIQSEFYDFDISCM